jgi:hypothetical protein
MRLSRVVAAATGMLVFASVTLASNSASFRDPVGDVRRGPDITAVSVSSDDRGTVTVRVTVANRPRLRTTEELGVGFDVDEDPDTGSAFYGEDYAVWLKVGRPVLFRATRSGRLEVALPPESLKGSFKAGVATFSFKGADLGIDPTSGFNLSAIDTSHSRLVEAAPNIRTFNYQLLRGTRPRSPGPDIRAPLDEARPSPGIRGKIAHLLYFASDGRAVTADTVRVYRGRRRLRTLRTPLSDKNPNFLHSVSWRVPPKAHGKLHFCVSSVDAAGNKSNTSCARLIVR